MPINNKLPSSNKFNLLVKVLHGKIFVNKKCVDNFLMSRC